MTHHVSRLAHLLSGFLLLTTFSPPVLEPHLQPHSSYTQTLVGLRQNYGHPEYVNPLESRGNYSATSNNMKSVHWPLMGGLLHLVPYSEDGTGRDRSPPRPLLAIPNVTAQPSTASVPITVLLYYGPLPCCFNVGITWLNDLTTLYGRPYCNDAKEGVGGITPPKLN